MKKSCSKNRARALARARKMQYEAIHGDDLTFLF